MLIDQIRDAALTARKSRDRITATLLITLIGEADSVSKNQGKPLTDADTIALIQKFVKGINEVISILEKDGTRTVDLGVAVTEKIVLESFLPKQLSEDEIRDKLTFIKDELVAAGTTLKMGDLLQLFKIRFGGQFDGRIAATVAKSLLS